jgi:hypothetical protein
MYILRLTPNAVLPRLAQLSLSGKVSENSAANDHPGGNDFPLGPLRNRQ